MPNHPLNETEEVVKAAQELLKFLNEGGTLTARLHRQALETALANLDKVKP